MKTKIALRALLAAISTASRANGRIPNPFRDPRTVEAKEDVRRQAMGTHFLTSLSNKPAGDSTCGELIAAKVGNIRAQWDKPMTTLSDEVAESLACSAISKELPECLGCQGFERKGKEVHIPGCVEMTSDQCIEFAKGIVLEKSEWFKDGANTKLNPEELQANGENPYYYIGLPVSADDNRSPGERIVQGLAGDCIVQQFPWDWCVSHESGSTACIKIGPWDCPAPLSGGCLSSNDCCSKIQGEHLQDINGNRLQCYEWVIPSKSSSGGGGGTGGGSELSGGGGGSGEVNQGHLVGNRLEIHLNIEKEVALPAVITDGPGTPDDGETKNVSDLGTIQFVDNEVSEQICVEVVPNDGSVRAISCTGNADQEFYHDLDTMQIKHSLSEKCLTPDSENYDRLVMKDCKDVAIQKWYLDGSTKELKNAGYDANQCVSSPSHNGASLSMQLCSGWSECQITFQMTMKNEKDTPDIADIEFDPADIGRIRSGPNLDMCIEKNAEQNYLQVRTCNNSANQDFEYDVNTMQIKLRSSGLCLEMSRGIFMTNCNDSSPNQKWYTTDDHELKSAADECLTVGGMDIFSGTCNGFANQKFVCNFQMTKK